MVGDSTYAYKYFLYFTSNNVEIEEIVRWINVKWFELFFFRKTKQWPANTCSSSTKSILCVSAKFLYVIRRKKKSSAPTAHGNLGKNKFQNLPNFTEDTIRRTIYKMHEWKRHVTKKVCDRYYRRWSKLIFLEYLAEYCAEIAFWSKIINILIIYIRKLREVKFLAFK